MSKAKANKTYVVMVLMAALLLVCCAVPGIIRPVSRHPSATDPSSHTRVKMAWQTFAGKLTDLIFSPGAKFLACVDTKGAICVYKSTGEKQYTASVQGADKVVVSPDGKYAMAYSNLDLENATCTFLDNKGNTYWKLNVNGAVWSADVCNYDGNARFVIGTGTRRVYVVDIGMHKKYYRWWTAPGVVVSMYLEPDGESVVIGTWQDSSVERRDIRGRSIWSMNAGSACLPMIERFSSSDRLLVRYVPNNSSVDGSYEIISTMGKTIARGDISVSDNQRVLFDPTCSYTCISHTEVIKHKVKSMVEKRTVLQTTSGARVWEKGSAFFQTDPIMVTAGGEVLLRDATNAVFMTNSDGALKQVTKLRAKPLRCACSEDGSLCALSCSDGSINLLKLSK
ncbi:hypothetical protein LLG46_06015 [bacterium]|nr:hypothetical protein [bacterium]